MLLCQYNLSSDSVLILFLLYINFSLTVFFDYVIKKLINSTNGLIILLNLSVCVSFLCMLSFLVLFLSSIIYV